MFIWDFIMGDVMDQFIDWVYGQVVGFLGEFFGQMGNMGVELFEMSWVQSVVLFFSYLAWSLYVVGLVVSCFETGIEYQHGRGSTKETALYALKGFFAVSLFTVVPVRLFQLSVELQQSLTTGITGYGSDFGEVANSMLESITNLELGVTNLTLGGLSGLTSPVLMLFILFMMGYAVIKVFFASLKRGGILLILIAVGSLYMFSIPRGYIDGFIQWCKQVIGLCLTSFLQATILTAGLMVLGDYALLGLGLMLSAGEVPRIAGAFGLETSARGSLTGALHTAQAAVSATRTVVQVVSA